MIRESRGRLRFANHAEFPEVAKATLKHGNRQADFRKSVDEDWPCMLPRVWH